MIRMLSWFALVLIGVSASAQELTEGQQYHGGATVISKPLGIELTVPTGWTGTMSGDFFVLTSQIQGLVAVMSETATAEEAQAFLSAPQVLANRYVLTPTAAPTLQGDRLTATCTVSDGGRVWTGEVTILMGPHGIAAGVIAAGQDTDATTAMQAGKQVAESLKFAKPVVPSPGESSGYWADYLKNKTLKQFDTTTSSDGSSSFSRRITLCANGHFSRYHSGSGYSETNVSVSYAGNSSFSGKWSVTGDQLHLFYDDGDQGIYTVSKNKKRAPTTQRGSVVTEDHRV